MLTLPMNCTRIAAMPGLVPAMSRPPTRFSCLLMATPTTITTNQSFIRQASYLALRRGQQTPVTQSTNMRSSSIRSLATASAKTPPISSTASATSNLSWNEYLSLRQKRRYYNLSSSMVTGIATFAGGVSFLMTQDLDKLSSYMFGFDPFMALGFAGIVFGAAGWLAGPFAGEAVFRLAHRRVMGQMELKEMDFYHRIKKYRCDPSAQSVSNPVPDYYGEKISSVKGYRQWLKDQRAFRKKRETPMA